MTKDRKKPKASHKHVVCERVNLFWLQKVSKENWDIRLIANRQDGRRNLCLSSLLPRGVKHMACVPHPARKIKHLMWIINDLLVCGSRHFSPAEHPCRYGWVFIFYGHVANHMWIYVKEERGADVQVRYTERRGDRNWIQACQEKWKNFFQWYWRLHSWVQIV